MVAVLLLEGGIASSETNYAISLVEEKWDFWEDLCSFALGAVIDYEHGWIRII
jgi:hypothetical protein